jgi:hypothetical protein
MDFVEVIMGCFFCIFEPISGGISAGGFVLATLFSIIGIWWQRKSAREERRANALAAQRNRLIAEEAFRLHGTRGPAFPITIGRRMTLDDEADPAVRFQIGANSIEEERTFQ